MFNNEGGPPEANSSPGPGAYELENGNRFVQLSVNDMGALNDGSPEGFCSLNVDGTVSLLPSGSVESVCPECYVMGGALLKYSGRFLDIFTGGYGLNFGKVSFLYQLPRMEGRMIFRYDKFRLQYGKKWGGSVQPWYKRTYLKLPGKTNKHWPWQ